METLILELSPLELKELKYQLKGGRGPSAFWSLYDKVDELCREIDNNNYSADIQE